MTKAKPVTMPRWEASRLLWEWGLDEEVRETPELSQFLQGYSPLQDIAAGPAYVTGGFRQYPAFCLSPWAMLEWGAALVREIEREAMSKPLLHDPKLHAVGISWHPELGCPPHDKQRGILQFVERGQEGDETPGWYWPVKHSIPNHYLEDALWRDALPLALFYLGATGEITMRKRPKPDAVDVQAEFDRCLREWTK